MRCTFRLRHIHSSLYNKYTACTDNSRAVIKIQVFVKATFLYVTRHFLQCIYNVFMLVHIYSKFRKWTPCFVKNNADILERYTSYAIFLGIETRGRNNFFFFFVIVYWFRTQNCDYFESREICDSSIPPKAIAAFCGYTSHQAIMTVEIPFETYYLTFWKISPRKRYFYSDSGVFENVRFILQNLHRLSCLARYLNANDSGAIFK